MFYYDKYGKGLVVCKDGPYLEAKYDSCKKPIRYKPKYIGRTIKLIKKFGLKPTKQKKVENPI